MYYHISDPVGIKDWIKKGGSVIHKSDIFIIDEINKKNLQKAWEEIKNAGASGCSTRIRDLFAKACVSADCPKGVSAVAKIGLSPNTINEMLSYGIVL